MNAIAEPRLSPSLSPNLSITARDVTGQRTYAVKDLPADTTVQDLVRGLIARMGLPRQDSTGATQSFHAFLERDGRHLQASESVGQALRNEDEIVLHPDVQAGAAVDCLAR